MVLDPERFMEAKSFESSYNIQRCFILKEAGTKVDSANDKANCWRM